MGSGNNVSDNSNLPSTVGQTFLSDIMVEQTGRCSTIMPRITVTYYFDTTINE